MQVTDSPPAAQDGSANGNVPGNGSDGDYWQGVSSAAVDRFCDALDRLNACGFSFDGDYSFNWRLAAAKFTSPTLWQVFALAQILKREQPITARGAFYRAVSAGIYPDTADEHYRSCGRLILQLRRFGFVPYYWISDSTRRRLKPSSWSGLSDFAETVAQAYRKDLWERQTDYVEVFVEKDAMAGVIEPITDAYDVTLNVIRGSCSETFVYRVAEIWKQIHKPIFIFYLGDHDPSGLKIEEDLRRRLEGFGAEIYDWIRLAVTREDFDNPDLLGFPIKRDKKGEIPKVAQAYLQEFGDPVR